jgi:5-methyltetrahydrofolate--homocysteine methyltransferase
MSVLKDMAEAVVKGDMEECERLSNVAIEQGIEPVEAIQAGFAKGMETVGNRFESGQLYLPEMMLAAQAMNAGIKVLRPHIAKEGSKSLQSSGKVALATIQGDMHDIGKNIVNLMMSTSGFDVIDLGKDVKVSNIIKEAKKADADIIGVSALMTTTMGYMPVLIDELSELGLRKDFKVMVGGAPVTPEWAEEIGCDGYAKDAVAAVKVARKLVGK